MTVQNIDEVTETCQSSEGFFFKMVAANDVGATGSHQAGFYMPRNSWPLFLATPGRKGENVEQFIDIRWPDGTVRRSRFIWYGKGTRSEYRLTRGFDFLSGKDIGRLLVLAKTSGNICHGFLLDVGEQTEAFFTSLSLTSDDQYIIHVPSPAAPPDTTASAGSDRRRLHEELLKTAIDAALAAIEVYNKPHFQYREQIFSILIVNAWELLFKAKIVHDAGDDVSSIYISLPGRGFKMNRSGVPLTQEITGLLRSMNLPQPVCDNIEQLVALRDTAIHFYHRDRDALRYILFGLGAATLRNFEKLVQMWFGRGLQDYDFYILPLGFSYSFRTLTMLSETRTGVVASVIESVREGIANATRETEFDFLCEIRMSLVSSKKISDESDLIAKVDQDGGHEAIVVEKLQRPIDRYPLSYQELIEKVRSRNPGVKQQRINEIIKHYNLKSDPRFASYHFRTKRQDETHRKTGVLPKSVTCIYNEDAVRFICEKIG